MQRRNRKQKGSIVKIGGSWYVRYWEPRNEQGTIIRKRVSHVLGPVTTRGKRPPADIVSEAEEHMVGVNSSGTKGISPDRVVTIRAFVEEVYLPWIEKHKRPSTCRGYRDIWEDQISKVRVDGKVCIDQLLKNVRTYHVQSWLDTIALKKLSRNSLKHVKTVISAMFKLAKQQNYFQNENPARDTAVDPSAKEPEDTYAYCLEEIQTILSLLPEPATTAFAVASFMGLRHGEIQGLLWENYKDGEYFVSRSIWNGHENEPKTRKSRAPVPVIRQLADRLELHRLRCGNPQKGPIFATSKGNPVCLNNVVSRVILPALNRCEVCGKSEGKHSLADHEYKRDKKIPEWHGWHAARRGLGSNLNRLGVDDSVIQTILRHSSITTTQTFYIKTSRDDARNAMTQLETQVSLIDSQRTQEQPTKQASQSVN